MLCRSCKIRALFDTPLESIVDESHIPSCIATQRYRLLASVGSGLGISGASANSPRALDAALARLSHQGFRDDGLVVAMEALKVPPCTLDVPIAFLRHTLDYRRQRLVAQCDSCATQSVSELQSTRLNLEHWCGQLPWYERCLSFCTETRHDVCSSPRLPKNIADARAWAQLLRHWLIKCGPLLRFPDMEKYDFNVINTRQHPKTLPELERLMAELQTPPEHRKLVAAFGRFLANNWSDTMCKDTLKCLAPVR